MNHDDKVQAIKFIKPNAEFYLSDDKLVWFDKEQTEPTEKEIKDGLVAYKAHLVKEAEAKTVQKQQILDRIGLTADELQTILG